MNSPLCHFVTIKATNWDHRLFVLSKHAVETAEPKGRGLQLKNNSSVCKQEHLIPLALNIG